MSKIDGQRFWAVVPAAGYGARFGGEVPKQYARLGGKSILENTLTTLLAEERITGLTLVLSPSADSMEVAKKELSSGLLNHEKIQIARGGATRATSVLNGLNDLTRQANSDDFVLVHDAARPLLHKNDLRQLITTLADHTVGGMLASPVVDTLKRVSGKTVVETQQRDQLWAAQTPQMFRLGLLVNSLQRAADKKMEITDESMAIEISGHEALIVQAQYANFKITHISDLQLAEAVLNERAKGRAI